MSFPSDLANTLGAAEEAAAIVSEAQAEFRRCCQSRDWEGAEAARERARLAFDVYLDHIAAGYKRIESFDNGEV